MALQDLTPQLRTRLSRVERAVGWFVFVATALLLFGFCYYIYHTAESRGWFTPKFKYETWVNNAAGLKPGDPVKLMGRNVGQITEIKPNAPDAFYGMTVFFYVLKPNYGYIWDDSVVRVSSDFLGNRFLEISKGVSGLPTIDDDTNQIPQAMLNWRAVRQLRPKVLDEMRKEHPDMEQTNKLKFNWFVTDDFKRVVQSERQTYYTNLTEIYGIHPEEAPALNDRLEALAQEVENALPNILSLTNKIAAVLDNTSMLTSNLNVVAAKVPPLLDALQPTVTNLARITEQVQGPGTLGEWLIPTNLNQRLDTTLGSADTAVESLTESLNHIADLTSNLNAQVQANSNMLSGISQTVVDADDFVQGLKRHWLLRSAFKTKATNAPPAKAKSK